MKKTLLTLMMCAMLTGCRAEISSLPIAGETIPYQPEQNLEGPAGVLHQFDVKSSPYYLAFDFYNMKSDGSLTILENFKTVQQTTETTCGPACLIMVLEHYGRYEGQSDTELYELRENKDEPPTMLSDMAHILESLGEWEMFSTYDLDDPSLVPADLIINSLKDGNPVLIGDDDWGGHWRIIIGYDNMGDDIEANDVLIVADPYDTTDHYQDGYTVIPFQRLYYNWSNRFDPDFTHNIFLIARPT